MSVEDVTAAGEYRTGVGVNLVRKIPERHGTSPSEYARRLIAGFAAKNEVVEQKAFTEGPFKTQRLEFRNHSDPAAVTHLVATAAANDKTGSVYFMMFESPEASWEKAFAVAKPILTMMALDDEM